MKKTTSKKGKKIEKFIANRYDYILKMFAQADKYRPVFDYVSKHGNYAYAITHAHMVIKVPLELCGIQYKEVEKFPHAENLFSQHISSEENICHVSNLVSGLLNSEYVWRKKMKECEKCNGEGLKTCKCCDYENDCRTCDGTGESDEAVPFAKIKLHNATQGSVSLFNRAYDGTLLNQIAMTAMMLGIDTMTFSNNKDLGKGCIVTLGEVKILIMPKAAIVD